VTVRGGKIIRTEVYSSPEEARDAVGVAEQAVSQNVEAVRALAQGFSTPRQ
jgi:hypothetical protein